MAENNIKEPEELDTQMRIECSGCYETVDECDNCHESEGIDFPGKVVHLEVTEWEYKHFCSMDCAEQWMKEEGFRCLSKPYLSVPGLRVFTGI